MAKPAKSQASDKAPATPRQPDPRPDDNWPVHPANTAPKMSDDELKVLAADIKKHGLHNPIIYWEDNREAANGSKGPFPLYLLDGVNRAKPIRLLKLDGYDATSSGTHLVDLTLRVYAIRQVVNIGLGGGGIRNRWKPDIDP
jgi:hypothetical protein